ncbi:MAG TPA: calcium-binding protein [Candidatus Acidoferrum sp.]|nr:calcium-binding protein [Candidatus Acidoferrum sp.]
MAIRIGTATSDTLNGTNGMDLLFGLAGSDAIFARGGADIAFGGAGDDTIDGGNGNDTLSGEDGNDSLSGGAGADHLDGGVGDDIMAGGKGNDVYIVDSALDQVVEEGNGGVDLVRSTVDIAALADNVENLILETNPVLTLFATGNDLDNWISVVGGGTAMVDAAGGNDTMIGGDPTPDPTTPGFLPGDSLAGGEGNDFIVGNGGDDELLGDGFSALSGGNDTLIGGAGSDRMDGGDGNDLLLGGDGDDGLSGDAITMLAGGNDTLIAGAGNDAVNAGAGHDIVFGGTGNDNVNGGGGNDYIDGGAGNDFILGGDGFDDGSDTILGGTGNDDINGDFPGIGGAADLIVDGTGSDIIRGFTGADEIHLVHDGETDFVGGYFFAEDLGDLISGFDTRAPGVIPDPDPNNPGAPLPPIHGGDVLVFDGLGFPGPAPTDVASAVAGGFLAFADSGKGGTNVLIDFDGGGDNLQVAATLEGVAFSPGIQATLEDNIVFQPVILPAA